MGARDRSAWELLPRVRGGAGAGREPVRMRQPKASSKPSNVSLRSALLRKLKMALRHSAPA
ncbi:hypothetical protein KFK09_020156 [Dendrobium nobile]|uniref:Uncharacterized protein n=1 Tax=Dendrobium nobile TaxID=94219 RepID=A0A8T3AS26_DENNO|nr:hypothetical protein KFK09_020156 [Dendrobium nobile]